MKQNIIIATLYTSLICLLLTLAYPQTTLTVEASNYQTGDIENTNSNRSALISWRFKYIDDVLYKRLYDYSTGTWIGDWILV